MSQVKIEFNLPQLIAKPWNITSPLDKTYNCIAWAVGKNDRWYWPSPDGFWPDGVIKRETLAAFLALFRTIGYKICKSDELEDGFEKIAIFVLNNQPKHAARQLEDGSWTSKLGNDEDISHNLQDIEGQHYGQVVLIMKRRRP